MVWAARKSPYSSRSTLLYYCCDSSGAASIWIESVVSGAPNWRYVFEVERDELSGRVVSVSHFVSPIPEPGRPDRDSFKLEFRCDRGGYTAPAEGWLTPSVPKLELSFDVDAIRQEFMDTVRIDERGRHIGVLDVRVDSKSSRAYEIPVGLSGAYIPRNSASKGNLIEYMRGGSEMIVRLRGLHNVRRLNIAGFDLAYAKINEECVERQQTVYKRADPFEWTP